MGKPEDLTQSRLQELLSYDPGTGSFQWLKGRHVGRIAGVTSEYGYVRIKIGPKRHMAHRLAWLFVYGEFPALSLDHIDGDRARNAIENLRQATASQQGMNRKTRRDNKTGLKGVSARVDGRFEVRISINGRQRTIGYRSTPGEAHAFYARAAETHFGDYRRLS